MGSPTKRKWGASGEATSSSSSSGDEQPRPETRGADDAAEHTTAAAAGCEARRPSTTRKRRRLDAAGFLDDAAPTFSTATPASPRPASRTIEPSIDASDAAQAGRESEDAAQQDSAETPPRVAVLVPFRDNHAAQKRRAHLDVFVPYMTAFLQRHCGITGASFRIFVLEQSLDGRKFNRGKLLNAGFDLTRAHYDVFIFHDVDLLPDDELGELYAQRPSHGPMHIARVWDRYNQDRSYFGGIVSFTRQHFIRINGFPNNFWGWGGEDNELYSRVMCKKLIVQAPTGGSIRDLEELDLQQKLAVLRATKWKCTVKRQLLKEHHRTWKKNGIKSLRYEYVDAEALNDYCTKITVNLGPNDHWSDARSSLERHDVPVQVVSSTIVQQERKDTSSVLLSTQEEDDSRKDTQTEEKHGVSAHDTNHVEDTNQ